jgi:hypothetical protein
MNMLRSLEMPEPVQQARLYCEMGRQTQDQESFVILTAQTEFSGESATPAGLAQHDDENGRVVALCPHGAQNNKERAVSPPIGGMRTSRLP